MRIDSAPVEEGKDATEDGSGVDLGGVTRFKEADYDGASGPHVLPTVPFKCLATKVHGVIWRCMLRPRMMTKPI
jgi:hypothetical protein